MLAGFAAYPPLTRRAGHRDKEQQYKGSGRLAAENGIDYDTLYRQDKVFPEFRTSRHAQGMQLKIPEVGIPRSQDIALHFK